MTTLSDGGKKTGWGGASDNELPLSGAVLLALEKGREPGQSQQGRAKPVGTFERLGEWRHSDCSPSTQTKPRSAGYV